MVYVGQDYFIVIVSEFLYIPWKHAQEQTMLRAAAKASNTTYCTPSVTVTAAANAESIETSFLKDQVFTNGSFHVCLLKQRANTRQMVPTLKILFLQISSYFTEKLLRIVRDVLRHLSAKQRDDVDTEAVLNRDFPKLAGSHLQMGDPALEFIKFPSL